jgi:hypothetical protein
MPTIMELGVLFAQMSFLPDSQKGDFIRHHPEVKNDGLVDWALMGADLREPEDRRRILNAALYLAIVLGDNGRQNTVRAKLASR